MRTLIPKAKFLILAGELLWKPNKMTESWKSGHILGYLKADREGEREIDSVDGCYL